MSILITWDEDEQLVIRDVHAKWHERVLKFMLEHQYRPHPLYTQLRMQDDAAVERDYEACLRHLLQGECCIVAVANEEDAQDILAVAIVKWMSRKWRSWTMFTLIPSTQQWTEWLALQLLLLNADAQAAEQLAGGAQTSEYAMRPRDSLHLFEYYACEALRDDAAFMARFLHAICEVARHMYMPRVTFAAYSMLEQRHAEAAGFAELGRILYSMHLNRDGCRPFQALRDLDEMFVALYERPVGVITPYKQMPGFEELEERMRLAALKFVGV